MVFNYGIPITCIMLFFIDILFIYSFRKQPVTEKKRLGYYSHRHKNQILSSVIFVVSVSTIFQRVTFLHKYHE